MVPLRQIHADTSSRNAASSGDRRQSTLGLTTTLPFEVTVLTQHSSMTSRPWAESSNLSATKSLARTFLLPSAVFTVKVKSSTLAQWSI
jgi:hypothetical protein